MIIKLYENTSSDNTMNKILLHELVIENVKIRSDFELMNPYFLLSGDESIKDFNYLHLVDLDRYYFINSIESVRFNLFKLSCSVDLLETYKSDILESNASYLRKLGDGDYVDSISDLSVESVKTKYTSDVVFPDIKETLMITVGV